MGSNYYNTLAYHLDSGGSIWAYCHTMDCGHSAKLVLEALAAKLGRDHGALRKDLVPYLRCSKCGGRDISIRIGTTGRPGD